MTLSFLSPDAMAELEQLIDQRVREALVHERAKRWMTVAETADYLGITQAAVRHRIERGRIPAKHQGRSLLVDRVALDRRIEAAS